MKADAVKESPPQIISASLGRSLFWPSLWNWFKEIVRTNMWQLHSEDKISRGLEVDPFGVY